MSNHEHAHEHEAETTYGMALGFRIIEDGGKLFLAEAEISPYVDESDELGATLVFHPLDGIDPLEASEEIDWPAWPIDIDEELTRSGSDPVQVQFTAIVRQLRGLSEDDLRDYLRAAMEAEEQ
jgi:hypothetical protein